MGIIFGKFRKKKTTYEQIEKLDNEIRDIEEYRRNTEQTHKRIVGRFIVISIGIYLLVSFFFYFYYFPASFYDRLFYIIPLILAPVIILIVKRVLTWYYKWKINRKQNKLTTLRDEKKKMLEKVMETETYKVAKTILDKFAPETSTRKAVTSELTVTPVRSSVATGLRQRNVPSAATPFRPVGINFDNAGMKQPQQQIQATPRIMPAAPAQVALMNASGIPTVTPRMPTSTPLPMPRPILPRERSVFDKMVDYLVGDGPSNRYALICKSCYSHNGMVFREEFEYISFRCCYCFTFNPARKKRPAVPKLEIDLKPQRTQSQSDTSESEKNSPSDTDSDAETLRALRSSVIIEKKESEQKPDEVSKDITESTGNKDDVNAEEDTKVGDVNPEEDTKVEDVIEGDGVEQQKD